MNILIVGSTGKLGSKITESLLKSNHKIHLLIRPSSISKADVIEFQQNGASIIKGDISESETLEKALKNIDIVISTTRDIHVETSLFQSIQKIDSIKCYIPSFWIPDPINLKKGENIEWDSKIGLLEDIKKSKVPYIILFCGLFLDSPQFLGIDLIQDRIQVFGDGNQKIPVIHSTDVANLVPLILESKEYINKSLHLISDYYSTNDVLEWVGKKENIHIVKISEADLEESISFYSKCNNINAVKNLHWQKNIFFSDKLYFKSDILDITTKLKKSKEYFDDYLQGKETLLGE